MTPPVSLGDPGDLRGFPATSPPSRLVRVCRAGSSTCWYSSDGSGRFDLRPPEGTCYLATDAYAAIREASRLGPVSTGWVHARELREVAPPDQGWPAGGHNPQGCRPLRRHHRTGHPRPPRPAPPLGSRLPGPRLRRHPPPAPPRSARPTLRRRPLRASWRRRARGRDTHPADHHRPRSGRRRSPPAARHCRTHDRHIAKRDGSPHEFSL